MNAPPNEDPYRIKVESFEGPLDLLLYLIKKNELDVCEVSLSKISEEYLNFVHGQELSNLENAGEFILVAATLIFLKSRALLPEPPPLEDGEEEIVSPEELVRKLLEYKKYKDAAEDLKKKNTLFDTVFTRLTSESSLVEMRSAEPLLEVKPSELLKAFERILLRFQYQKVHEIREEPIPTAVRINQVFDFLKEHEDVSFAELFADCQEKHMVIVTFLSILEMAKLSLLKIVQDASFQTIRIHSQIALNPKAEEMIRNLLTQEGEIPSFSASG